MKNKKILILVITIFMLLIIACISFGYLYIATDTFKSSKELFAKYMTQNIEMFNEIIDSSTKSTYENAKNENMYESDTKITIAHSVGGEISNPINDLSMNLYSQKDEQNEYFYTDSQILFKDEEYLEFEAIKDNGVYGIRFPDAVKQFTTVKEDNNFEIIAEDIGIETSELETFLDILDGKKYANELIMTNNEVSAIKDKYLNIVKESFNNATFSSLEKSMITVDNNTIKANAYTATLSKEQVQNLIIQIFNNIKTDEIILEKIEKIISREEIENTINSIIEKVSASSEISDLKITVYEQKQQVVRTVFEMEMSSITIENLSEEGQLKTNLQIKNLNSEENDEKRIEIVKNNSQNTESYNINIDILKGEKNNTITFTNEMQSNNGIITMNTRIDYKEDITTISLIIKNNFNITNAIEKKQNLDQANNIILNDLNSETRKHIIELIKQAVPQKITSRINLLTEALKVEDNTEPEEQTPDGTQMSQTDVNRFNAKFEFYTGDSVTAENVKTLLEVVKSNLNSVQIIPVENQESLAKESIRLNIEKDKENTELINQVLEKIEDNKKYKVSIFYKGNNQIIDYITINEID